jgi:hypothetical protein
MEGSVAARTLEEGTAWLAPEAAVA